VTVSVIGFCAWATSTLISIASSSDRHTPIFMFYTSFGQSLIALLPVRSSSCKAGSGDAKQGSEGGVLVAPAVEAGDEFIKGVGGAGGAARD
jgi:hypothetical protein